jgi:hypothetical protein
MEAWFLSISVLLLVLAISFFRKVRLRTLPRLMFCVATLASMLSYILYFIADSFTGEGFNKAAAYHLMYGLQGAGFKEYIVLVVLSSSASLLAIAFSAWLFIAKSHPKKKPHIKVWLAFILLLLSIVSNPLVIFSGSLAFDEIMAAGNGVGFYDYYELPGLKRVGESIRPFFQGLRTIFAILKVKAYISLT